MDYNIYINKYNSAEEIQAALDEGTLKKPYIGMIEDASGNTSIDFDTLEPEPDYKAMPLTFEIISGGVISYTSGGSVNPGITQYKKNEEEWVTFTDGDSVSVSAGDIIQFKGEKNELDSSLFSTTANTDIRFNVYGNILSLLDSSNYEDLMDISLAYAFNGIFSNTNCPGVVSAKKLILQATGLTEGCYAEMFRGNTSLVEAPEKLPALYLPANCYRDMFGGCTNLASIPTQLPAIQLNLQTYAGMFTDCTSLERAPEILATETLGTGSLTNMFKGCTSLVTPPSALYMSTLKVRNYENMFSGCTSLQTAPVICATTLAASSCTAMFYGCTSLQTAPALPALTMAENCYSNMFNSCTSLVNPPVLPSTDLRMYCYRSMFNGCTSLATAPALPAPLAYEYCYSYMFKDTAITQAPALPATTIENGCYNYMFQNCTGLTSAPELPAPTAKTYSYRSMFSGCTNLNYIKCMATTLWPNSTTNFTNGVSATGTFVKAVGATWTTGVNGIPDGWTVEE